MPATLSLDELKRMGIWQDFGFVCCPRCNSEDMFDPYGQDEVEDGDSELWECIGCGIRWVAFYKLEGITFYDEPRG